MDMSHVIAFVAGAMGKLVGTWLVHFFKDAVLPYFQKHTNHTISITDDWILNHVGNPADGEGLNVEWKVHLKLQQKGHSVVGKANSVGVNGPEKLKDKQIQYEVSGSYTQNILDIHLTEIGDSALRNRSSLMLQLVGDGSLFDGYRIFLGRTKNQVRAIECQLIRKNACAQCGTA